MSVIPLSSSTTSAALASTDTYTAAFYDEQRDGSLRSARKILPYVLQLVPCRRIIDVGCGVGTWLRVCSDCGVPEILGLDGDYVTENALEIPRDRFIPCDLTRPLPIQERFDLAISLEVAEHLPEHFAPEFVRALTRLAPVVLFSAAIPMQGGADHINEQWPDYWIKLFSENGYLPIDCIRRRVWSDPDVKVWYAQNVMMFVAANHLRDSASLQAEVEKTIPNALSLVHPQTYLNIIKARSDPTTMSARSIAAALPIVCWNAIIKRLPFRNTAT